MAETEKKKQGKLSKWFREFKAEIKKIVWPSWKQIKNNTVVVVVMLLIITLVIFAFDTAFGKIVGLIISDDTAISQDYDTEDDNDSIDEDTDNANKTESNADENANK